MKALTVRSVRRDVGIASHIPNAIAWTRGPSRGRATPRYLVRAWHVMVEDSDSAPDIWTRERHSQHARKTRVRAADGRVIATFKGTYADEIVDVAKRKVWRDIQRADNVRADASIGMSRSARFGATFTSKRTTLRRSPAMDADVWRTRLEASLANAAKHDVSNWRMAIAPERGRERHTSGALGAYWRGSLVPNGCHVEEANAIREAMTHGLWTRTRQGYSANVGTWRLMLTSHLTGGIRLNGDVITYVPPRRVFVNVDGRVIRRTIRRGMVRQWRARARRDRQWTLTVYYRGGRVRARKHHVDTNMIDAIREASTLNAAPPHDSYLCHDATCETCHDAPAFDMDALTSESRKAMIDALGDMGYSPNAASMLLP